MRIPEVPTSRTPLLNDTLRGLSGTGWTCFYTGSIKCSPRLAFFASRPAVFADLGLEDDRKDPKLGLGPDRRTNPANQAEPFKKLCHATMCDDVYNKEERLAIVISPLASLSPLRHRLHGSHAVEQKNASVNALVHVVPGGRGWSCFKVGRHDGQG